VLFRSNQKPIPCRPLNSWLGWRNVPWRLTESCLMIHRSGHGIRPYLRSLTLARFPSPHDQSRAIVEPCILKISEPFPGCLPGCKPASFCPVGWARTDGQIVAISSNNALFSLFGTMYGGDGRTNFGLPDLRGRSALHVGNGPGVPSTPTQGAKLGSASFVLNQTNLPSHNHAANAAGNIANNQNPQGDLLAGALAYSSAAVGGAFSNSMLDNTGSNQTVNKRSPVQVLEYCVALVGIYPSRN